jgi:multidrug resistance efflux pump
LLFTATGTCLLLGTSRLGAQDDERAPVRAQGVVESAVSNDLRCEIVGGATVLSIVPEGTLVKRGELLVRLDRSALEEAGAAAEIELATAQAALAALRTSRESLQRQLAETKAAAELSGQVAAAERSAQLERGGELDVQLKELDSQLNVQRERLRLVEARLKSSEPGAGADAVLELRLAAVEARETIAAVEARRSFVDKHKREQLRLSLELAHALARLDMERRSADLARQSAALEADMVRGDAALRDARRNREHLESQLARCDLFAPVDGMVVYPSVDARRGGTSDFRIEEGASVREGQTLLRVVDPAHLRVRASVAEASLPRLRVGQLAIVQIDALPERKFRGSVSKISATPEPASWARAGVKTYAVHVTLEDAAEFARIGMTATVEVDAK